MLPALAEDGFNLSHPFCAGQTFYPNWHKLGRSLNSTLLKHGGFHAQAPQAKISLCRREYVV
jgi:hypothetical protein